MERELESQAMKYLAIGTTILLGALVSSCFGHWETVREKASKKLNCPGNTRVEELPQGGNRAMRALGCSKELVYVEACPEGLAPGHRSCDWLEFDEFRTASLKTRATFDMDCPSEALQLTKISHRTFGVNGCGHRSTYLWTCQGHALHADCTWVMNTDSVRREEDAKPSQSPEPETSPSLSL